MHESQIPNADQLREILSAESGTDVALVEIGGRAVYVGLDDDGALVEVKRT